MTKDLKLIAILTMIIDHLGFVFFPHLLIFRLIGRLSFPLFAWGVAQGAKHTRNWKKYAFRLFLFALISQYPYQLFSQIAPFPIARLNVLFTLLLGLLVIQVYKSKLPAALAYACICVLCLIADFLDADYQFPGVLTVFFSYLFMQNLPALLTSQFVIFSLPISISLITQSLNNLPAGRHGLINLNNYLPLLAPFAFLLPRFLPQTPQSLKSSILNKYWLYLVYPLQFFIIYFLKNLIS